MRFARQLDDEWEEILLSNGTSEHLGGHPWDTSHPIVLDMSAAAALGYMPDGSYAATVSEEVDWLVAAAHGGEEAGRLPQPDDPFFTAYLDYPAEDAYLAAHA